MAFRPMSVRRQWFISVLILALLSSDLMTIWTNAKRGGGGGFGRGSSAGRSSGGIFGGSRSSGTRTGTGGGYGGYNRGSSSGSSGGGIFGSSRTGTSGAGNHKWTNSKYSMGSGIGSKSRSSTFKNMVVGAAAGYLTYQAGKALIRSATAPMMWNNRPYYWGSNYYQGSPGGQMCRMPLDASDPQFGNIYFQDGSSRPKEIVWSCGYNEHCCGYECCPGGGGYGGGYGYRRGIGLGTILTLILLCGCGAFIIHQVCKTRRSGGFTSGRPIFGSNAKYTPGQATHAANNEPPPQYTPNPNGPGGSATNYTYPPAPNPPGFIYS